MDMISIGPQIEFPHSPDERVKIASVETFYAFLTKGLEKIAMEHLEKRSNKKEVPEEPP